jgi:hypothetical protein
MDKEFFPYEEALALRELGFNEQCFAFYIETKERQPASYSREGTFYPRNSDLLNGWHSAPTYSQAFRWFRENHNLEYQIMKWKNGNYYVTIHKNTQEYLDTISDLSHACLEEVVDCYSYEEAELECLRKLIEIIKEKTA